MKSLNITSSSHFYPFLLVTVMPMLALVAAVLWLTPAGAAHAQSPAAQTVAADWEYVPGGAATGDSFRLLFVTSATTNATSGDIADYNAFAQAAAGDNDDLKSFEDEFSALISTASVDAKDNTDTTGTGVPIYWLGGEKVADDYADLYDKDWDSVAGRTEDGSDYTGLVWTGGNKTGEKSGQRYAGADEVRLGDLSDLTLPLSSSQSAASGESYPVYALSPVIRVAEPEPEPEPESEPEPTSTPTPEPTPEPEPEPADPPASEAPTITDGPAIVSSPESGDTYGKGEAIVVEVTFSESVTVSGDVRVRLDMGGRTRWARYDHSRRGGAAQAFAYKVKGNDLDEDGVSVGANEVSLRGGSVEDTDGNAADLDHPALADQPGHKVNGSQEEQSTEVQAAPEQQSGAADRPGTVFLEAEPDPPESGGSLTATLEDLDGVVGEVAWSWERSSDGTTWDDVDGATAATYSLTNADAGFYLRATASYTDGHGPGKMATGALSSPVSRTLVRAEPEQQPNSNQERVPVPTVGGEEGEFSDPPVISKPRLTRTLYDKPSRAGLDVTWNVHGGVGWTISGYSVRYRKKPATSTPWGSYSVATVRSATTTAVTLYPLTPDWNAGAIYEAQVQAYRIVDDKYEGGPWSPTGEGRFNRPPTRNSALFYNLGGIAVGAKSSLPKADSQGARYFTDPDGDALTWSSSSEYPGILKTWVEDNTVYYEGLNPGRANLTYGVSDAYGGYATGTALYTGVQKETRSVAENSPAGTPVGKPVQGTPYQGTALTYTLAVWTTDPETSQKKAVRGVFVISPSTGQISVAEGATLDYETRATYPARVWWTVQGQEVAAQLTINIEDVEAGKPDPPTLRFRFDSPAGPSLMLTWTEAEANGLTITGYNFRYRKKGDTAWIETSSPLPATTTVTLANLDAGAEYEAQVRAQTSEEGPGPWSDSGVGTTKLEVVLIDANLAGEDVYYFENRTRPVATYGGNIVDDSALAWSLSGGADASLFRIRNGILRFKTAPDYENPTDADADNFYEVVVQASIASSTATRSVRVEVGDVNEPPKFTDTSTRLFQIIENSPEGANIGTPVTATDPDERAKFSKLTYSLGGADAKAFTISSSTGQIMVRAHLDYEKKIIYSVKVNVSDGYSDGNWQNKSVDDSVDVTINVTDDPSDEIYASVWKQRGLTSAAGGFYLVILSWDNPNNPRVSRYQYKQRTQGGSYGDWIDIPGSDGTTTSHTVTGLGFGDYVFMVRAVTSSGRKVKGMESNEASAEVTQPADTRVRWENGNHMFAKTISENGGSARLLAWQEFPLQRDTTFTISVSDPARVELSTTTLTIPAGKNHSSGYITVTAVDNDKVGRNPRVMVYYTVSNPLKAVKPQDRMNHTRVYIEDDD